MSEKERENANITENQNDNQSNGSAIKAATYEYVDRKEDGGNIHTTLYCFETNRPILKTD